MTIAETAHPPDCAGETIEELAQEFESVGARTPDRERYPKLADEILESVG